MTDTQRHHRLRVRATGWTHPVLAGFEADLSLYRLEENALSKHAAQLHQLTGGYFKALTYAISTAAVIAIRSGSENITEKEIKAATAQLGPWQPAADQP
ncbi:hypothetical protein ABZ904_41440 [Streptomyces sp. NPDC046900]|uniref:hypothetical protein n=1 Tax=Streptomyces sp. NPDC046900 TaxID=3155473 RepID=UPI0033E4AE80